MPPIHGSYPYHLGWDELAPDPGSLRDGADLDKTNVAAMLESLTAPELERVFDAALALSGRMLTLAEYKTWSRGEILAVALETAIIWERG